MATAQKLNDDFLTCSVCLKVFTDPSTLPCDHTFCGQCLVKYTKTKPDAIQARSLPCPFCSRLTKVKDPKQPVEKWAGHFKSGVLLQRLLESFGDDSTDVNNCGLCEKGGETNPASFWCSVCDVTLCDVCHKVHSRMALTSHHIVTDLSGEVKVRGKRRIRCQDHKDEFVTFHCRDCKQALCQTCCIVSHRGCMSVVEMKSMMSEMRNTLKTRRRTLTQQKDTEEEQVKEGRGQISQVEESKSSIRTQIRSATEAAISILREKERNLIKKLDDVADDVLIQLKADVKNGDMAIQIYKQQSEFIDQALKSDSEMEIYEQYMSCDLDLKKPRSAIRQPELSFSQDLTTLNRTLRDVSLGHVRLNRTLRDVSLGDVRLDYIAPQLGRTPKLERTLDCRVPGDTRDPSINDVACLDVGGTDTVVITDCHNSCVTSFYVRNLKQCHSRYKVESYPCRIAKLNDNKLAVSLQFTKKIIILKVSPELTLQSSFTTSKVYNSLTAVTSSTLAAGAYSSHSVDIIDMSGNLLQSLCPLYNGQQVIQDPDFLCTTHTGNILVSDWGTTSIECLTPRGDVVFNYHPTGDRALGCPSGIRSTATGDILVVDRDRNKVIQLSESGEFVRDVLTSQHGLSGPYGVDIDRNGNVCVSFQKGRKQNIQVFSFQ